MNFDNLVDDYNTQTYSEVDISEQMVYVFQNGQVVYSAKCVTGLPSDASRATKTGCWYIKDKKLEYTLTGADYTTPTKYWVRITWTGTGYHYMNRSDWSKWSPDLYKTRGSHGCINLQLEDVKNIYNLVSMRDMVFIHE
ncbi:MAG: L,D-transpeptidase [Coprobacillus sp.]|nr:L,D-transpeptidase [Coprobacillus sp.]